MSFDSPTPPPEQLIGVADVLKGDQLLVPQAIYRLNIYPPAGTVLGELRAPTGLQLTPYVVPDVRDWSLQLTLEDGRSVCFQLRAAQEAPGGWGDVEGRVERRQRRRY